MHESGLRALLIEEDGEATIDHAHLVELVTINLLKNEANKSAFKLRKYSLQQRVLQYAQDGKLQLVRQYGAVDPERRSILVGEAVDMWEEFRRFLTRARDQDIHEWDDIERENFVKAFRYIRGQTIANSRFIATTANNVASKDMHTNWAPASSTHGVSIVGDEAVLQAEADSWISTAPSVSWADKVVAWVHLGDEKQLAPFNATPRIGDQIYNELGERLGVALFTRLRRLGFPTVELKEQARMHPELAEFPNSHFYASTLRNALSTDNATARGGQSLATVSFWHVRRYSRTAITSASSHQGPSQHHKAFQEYVSCEP